MNNIAAFTKYFSKYLIALALTLRHCSGVNTRLPSEASAKDGLKGFLERSKKPFYPQLRYSSPRSPCKMKWNMGLNKFRASGNQHFIIHYYCISCD